MRCRKLEPAGKKEGEGIKMAASDMKAIEDALKRLDLDREVAKALLLVLRNGGTTPRTPNQLWQPPPFC